jgi:hypothetical protein
MRRPQDTRNRNPKFSHKGDYGAQKLNAGSKGTRAQALLRAFSTTTLPGGTKRKESRR